MFGIQQLEERPKLPIRGVIRLGYKDEGDRGRMHNPMHFVLKDAPDIATIYGDNPTEIDIVFPVDNISQVASSAYEYWSSVRDPEGKRQGVLVCRGNGPTLSGYPGEAMWYDRKNAPPQHEWIGERDTATGYLKRACYGDGARGACPQCVNYSTPDGKPQCRPTLKMLVLVPRVSVYEFFQITTKSWNTMQDIFSQLMALHRLKIPLPSRVFTLYKDTKAARPWDAAGQREFRTTINYMRMRENKNFMALYGATIKDALREIHSGGLSFCLPAAEQLAALPPPEFEEAALNVKSEPQTPEELVQELLIDADIVEGFEELEFLTGKTFSPKAREIAISKKISEADVKAAVLTELQVKIVEQRHLRDLRAMEAEKAAAPVAEPVAEPVVEPAPAPAAEEQPMV